MPERFTSSCSASGSGNSASTATTISGLVPQDTCGRMSAASIFTSVSNTASSSDTRVRQ